MAEVNWDELKREYETSAKTLKELAEEYGAKYSTAKSRRARGKWKKADIQEEMKTTKAGAVEVVETKVASPDQNKLQLNADDVEVAEGLTLQQEFFCIYYLKYFNATKAYQKAYGCTHTTARMQSGKLMKRKPILAEIDRLKEEQIVGIKLDVRHVLQKYIDIAFSDIGDFMEWGNAEVELWDEKKNEFVSERRNFVLFKNIEELDTSLIQEVKQGRDGVAIKLYDKEKALSVLMNYFDFLGDGEKRKLAEEKARLEIAKLQEELKTEEQSAEGGVVIYEGLDEMEAHMNGTGTETVSEDDSTQSD